MLRRRAASLVFAAAALASIATSMAPPWELHATAEIESTVVGSGRSLQFGITAEARGPADGHHGGDLSLSLAFQLESSIGGATSSPVRVVLESEDDASHREEQTVMVSAGGPTTMFLSLPAWLDCEPRQCFTDFRLTISEVAPDAWINVSGTADVTLRGRDPSPDPTHEARVSVTPLGAL